MIQNSEKENLAPNQKSISEMAHENAQLKSEIKFMKFREKELMDQIDDYSLRESTVN
jgi:hypothetical protein